MDQPDSTCWTLVLDAAAGVAEARETFSRRYLPVIRAYLSARWRIPFDHDDVIEGTQEVFLQCFKEGGALERIDPGRATGFRAFLYGVAQNVALMQERKVARRRERQGTTSFDPDNIERAEETLTQVFDKAWAEMLAGEARELLARKATTDDEAAERFRCLELRYVQDKAPREIARELGIDIQLVYTRLRRAREDYRDALLDVMRSYHPLASTEDLEQRYADLVDLL